jgi:hypothetical protein
MTPQDWMLILKGAHTETYKDGAVIVSKGKKNVIEVFFLRDFSRCLMISDVFFLNFFFR